MTEKSERWSKWWWLGYFGVETWSSEEQKARIALGMSTIPVIAILIFTTSSLLELAGVERHVAAVLAGLISLVPSFYSARPIAAVLYPDLLQRADQNAAARLSGKANQ